MAQFGAIGDVEHAVVTTLRVAGEGERETISANFHKLQLLQVADDETPHLGETPVPHAETLQSRQVAEHQLAQIGGIPELIQEDFNGLYFRSRDTDDLTAKIQAMYDAPFDHAAIALEAKKRYNS